jgi:hypothetical protein
MMFDGDIIQLRDKIDRVTKGTGDVTRNTKYRAENEGQSRSLKAEASSWT